MYLSWKRFRQLYNPEIFKKCILVPILKTAQVIFFFFLQSFISVVPELMGNPVKYFISQNILPEGFRLGFIEQIRRVLMTSNIKVFQLTIKVFFFSKTQQNCNQKLFYPIINFLIIVSLNLKFMQLKINLVNDITNQKDHNENLTRDTRMHIK